MWRSIKTSEYYLGMAAGILFCLLFTFCLMMTSGFVKISSIEYIDWSGAVKDLSKAGAPILLLSYFIKRRRKSNSQQKEEIQLPSREQIVQKAKENADILKQTKICSTKDLNE